MELTTEHYDDGSSFRAIDPLTLNPAHLDKFSIYEGLQKTHFPHPKKKLISNFFLIFYGVKKASGLTPSAFKYSS